MIKLKSLLESTDDNWNRWIQSMVSTVKDYLSENGESHTDAYMAYDIIKSDFRANSPSNEMFQKASNQAIEILKQNKLIQ